MKRRIYAGKEEGPYDQAVFRDALITRLGAAHNMTLKPHGEEWNCYMTLAFDGCTVSYELLRKGLENTHEGMVTDENLAIYLVSDTDDKERIDSVERRINEVLEQKAKELKK